MGIQLCCCALDAEVEDGAAGGVGEDGVAAGLGFVFLGEIDHRRDHALAEEALDGEESLLEAVEFKGVVASFFQIRKDADCGLGDDSKDALRADKEAREVHAGGDGAAEGAGADDFARRETTSRPTTCLPMGPYLAAR